MNFSVQTSKNLSTKLESVTVYELDRNNFVLPDHKIITNETDSNFLLYKNFTMSKLKGSWTFRVRILLDLSMHA